MSTTALPTHARYAFLERIGTGGMGVVYKARERDTGLIVALKTLRAERVEDRLSMEREIRVLRSLRHPGIVAIHDVGQLAGELFFTMEFLEGEDLACRTTLPPRNPEDVRRLVEVVLAVLDALGHLHDHGIAHGDLKPSNVFLVGGKARERCGERRGSGSPAAASRRAPPPGDPSSVDASTRMASGASGDVPGEIASEQVGPEFGTVKLLDFGLARWWGSAPESGSSGGTPLYMAPEQARGVRSDERSDLYSLGALVYHLLVGAPPFTTLGESLSHRIRPAAPAERNPACPPELSKLVLDLLDPLPHRRPATASSVAEALHALRSRGKTVARATTPRLLRPAFVGRDRELRELRSVLQDGADAKGRAVHISGAEGSGKSWLVERSGLRVEAVLDYGFAFVYGRFRRGGYELEAFKPFVRELRALCRGGLSGDSSLELTPAERAIVVAVGLSQKDQKDTDREAAPERVRAAQILDGAVGLMARAAELRPLCLVFEDVEHATRLEVELLARITAAVPRMRAVAIVTHSPSGVRRSSEVATWLEHVDEARSAALVVMEGFSDHDLELFVESTLGPRAPPSARFRTYLADRSGRQPLSAYRWLGMLRDRGALAMDAGHWDLRPSAELAAPEASLEERVRALDDAQLSVLAAATVAGGELDREMYHALLDERDTSARGSLGAIRSLAEIGFLVETAVGYAISPDIEPADVEPLLPPERVRRLHLRASGALLGTPHELSGNQLYQAARHLDLAGERDEAGPLYERAGDRASRSFANESAIAAFRRAVELCGDPESRLRVGGKLSDLHLRLGNTEKAIRILEHMAQEMEGGGSGVPSGGDRASVIALWDRLGSAYQRQGRLEEAERWFSLCARASDARTRARAAFRLGQVHFDRGQTEVAREFFARCLSLQDEHTPAEDRAAVYSSLGLVEKREERTAEAVECFERALDAARASTNPLLVATILNNLGNIHRARGSTKDALECLIESRKARELAGDRQGLAISLNNIARIQFQRGNLTAAARSTARALEIFEETGDRKGVLIARCNLGEFQTLQGRMDEARSNLESNMAQANCEGAQRLAGLTRSNLAHLELLLGNAREAERLWRQCLREPSFESLHDLRASTLTSLARALLDEGLTEAATDAVEEVMQLAPHWSRTGEVLAELTAVRMRLSVARRDCESAVDLGEAFLASLPPGIPRMGVARVERQLGVAYRELGAEWADRTEKHLDLALGEFERIECPLEIGETLVELGTYWWLVDEEEVAHQLFTRARNTFREIGCEFRVKRIEELVEKP